MGFGAIKMTKLVSCHVFGVTHDFKTVFMEIGGDFHRKWKSLKTNYNGIRTIQFYIFSVIGASMFFPKVVSCQKHILLNKIW